MLILFLLVMMVAVVTFIVPRSARSAASWCSTPNGSRATACSAARARTKPLKINVSGVIPPIFASSLLLMPATMASFGGAGGPEWLATITAWLGMGSSCTSPCTSA